METSDRAALHQPNDSTRLPKLPPDIAEALGQVTAGWAVIEGLLSGSIMILLKRTDSTGQAITAEMSTLSKMALISSLIGCTNNTAWINEWAAIQKTFDVARNTRNTVVHGFWAIKVNEVGVIRHRSKGKLSVTYEPIDITLLLTLRILLDEMYERMLFVLSFMEHGGIREVLSNPPARTDTQPPSPAAQAQAQVRETKKARREADRQHELARKAKPENG